MCNCIFQCYRQVPIVQFNCIHVQGSCRMPTSLFAPSRASHEGQRITLAAFSRPLAGGLTLTCSQRTWLESIEAVAPMRGATDNTRPVSACGPGSAKTMLGEACSSSAGLSVKSACPPPATPECPCTYDCCLNGCRIDLTAAAAIRAAASGASGSNCKQPGIC